ncbi:MAG: hypothetical protein JXB62_11410 [Pirellulales bacterium]|nr:hypothetical protein [Pirellulales bacterium]
MQTRGPSASTRSPTAYARRRKKSSWRGPLVAVIVAIGALALVVWALSNTNRESTPKPSGENSHGIGASLEGTLAGNGGLQNGRPTRPQRLDPSGPGRGPALRDLGSPFGDRPRRFDAFKPPEDQRRPPVSSAQDATPAGSTSGTVQNSPGDTAGSQPAVAGPLEVPVEEAIRQATEAIRRDTQFQSDFAATARPAKQALVQRLLDEQGDPARRYAALRLAQQEAVALGEIDSAFAAVDALGEQFQIDNVLVEKTNTLKAALSSTTNSGKGHLLPRILALQCDALAAGDVPTSDQLTLLALQAAKEFPEGTLRRTILMDSLKDHNGRVAAYKKDPKAASPEAVERLKALSSSPLFGGSAESEAAIDRALDWLARHQNPEGSWTFRQRRTGSLPSPQCLSECAPLGNLGPNAGTALAILPFLGRGIGPGRGEYGEKVEKGLTFLLLRISSLGNLHENLMPQLPAHALGTIALCEACTAGSSRAQRQIRQAAQVAVQVVVNTQNTDGGWAAAPARPRQPAGGSDVCTTGWNIAALRAAKWAGLSFDEKLVFSKAREYLEKQVASTDPSGAAVVMLSRMYCGLPRDDQSLSDYLASLSSPTVAPNRLFPVYGIYHNCQVVRHDGGAAWDRWNPDLRDALVQTQEQTGHAAGSWFFRSNEPMTLGGGRLFCTVMATLMLEVYYRHPPLYE